MTPAKARGTPKLILRFLFFIVRNSFRLIRGKWPENGGFTQGILPNLCSLCRGTLRQRVQGCYWYAVADRSEEIMRRAPELLRMPDVCHYRKPSPASLSRSTCTVCRQTSQVDNFRVPDNPDTIPSTR